MAIAQQIQLQPTVSTPTEGSTWSIGTTKSSRKINEQNLPADYVLTSINVNCTSIRNADGNNPAIIRVYQYGREASAVMIEISGVGEFIQPINLLISAKYGAERKVIVDAWDPDTTEPNNLCSLSGTISVLGRPFFSTAGATITN